MHRPTMPNRDTFLRKPPAFSTSSGAMRIRNIGVGALAILILVSGSGCKKSETNGSTQSEGAKVPTGPLATLHWIGMTRLAADPNAAGFLKIWRLPESDKLKSQTLD